MTRIFKAIFVTIILLLASAVVAQSADRQILSKDDTRAIFAMSREQWEANLSAAIALGQAQPYESAEDVTGMLTEHFGGTIMIVRPLYDIGSPRPMAIQVIVGYQKPLSYALTDAGLAATIDSARRQLAPEFDVLAHVMRHEAVVVVIFVINETKLGINN